MSEHAADRNVGHLEFDSRLSAYEGFLDYTWMQEFSNFTRDTKLDAPAIDLCTEWKSISNTFRFPWLTVILLENAMKGFMQTNEPMSLRVADLFCTMIRAEPGIPDDVRAKIATRIEGIAAEVRHAIAITPLPFGIDEMWTSLSQDKEFAFSIWGSTRVSFSALWHSYEAFLSKCVSIGKQDPHYRHRRIDQLASDLDTHVENGIGALCLKDDQIKISILIRNSLAHHSGKLTPELRAIDHNFPTTEDGRIHILPDYVRVLFNLLSSRLGALALKARSLPQFQNRT